MVREGKMKTDIEKVLVGEFRWETTGAPIRSVDGMIAGLKQ
jgi:hypothetical protein